MFYSLSIFNRKGACVYYWEWNKPHQSAAADVAEDQHLLNGMLYSMKLFVTQMAPPSAVASGIQTELRCFRTDSYALHFFGSATGVKIVAITDPVAPDLSGELAVLYRDVYVEYVVKNPFLLTDESKPITCDLFNNNVQNFVKKLPCFFSKPALPR